MNHLLKMLDLSKEEIIDILNLADQLKYENKNGIEHKVLKGKTLGMIFQKSSTRTRVSFETGMYQLGGQALFLSNRDLQIGRGQEGGSQKREGNGSLDEEEEREAAQQQGNRQVHIRHLSCPPSRSARSRADLRTRNRRSVRPSPAP